MAIQTSFAKKMAGSQDCNDRFLALLRNDGELDLAFLDVKNRVRDLSLRKNNLILPIGCGAAPVNTGVMRAPVTPVTFMTQVRRAAPWRSSKSGVSRPSVNQSQIDLRRSRPSSRLP